MTYCQFIFGGNSEIFFLVILSTNITLVFVPIADWQVLSQENPNIILGKTFLFVIISAFVVVLRSVFRRNRLPDERTFSDFRSLTYCPTVARYRSASHLLDYSGTLCRHSASDLWPSRVWLSVTVRIIFSVISGLVVACLSYSPRHSHRYILPLIYVTVILCFGGDGVTTFFTCLPFSLI